MNRRKQLALASFYRRWPILSYEIAPSRCQYRSHASNDTILIRFGHRSVQGQAYALMIRASRFRKVTWLEVVRVTPIGMQVQRYEVNAGPDTGSR
jgi:hypothetical protein